jgi:hypothetical protein
MATTCLNCGTELMDHQNFCPDCGQKTDTPRISFLYLAKEFWAVFAHADKGLFNLVKRLAVNPGRVAIDYVEGRRKRYFNPFGFLIADRHYRSHYPFSFSFLLCLAGFC